MKKLMLVVLLIAAVSARSGFAQAQKSDETVVQMERFQVVESKFRNPLFAYRPVYERSFEKNEKFKVVQALQIVNVFPEGASVGLKVGDFISRVGDFIVDQHTTDEVVANNAALFVPGAEVKVFKISHPNAQTATKFTVQVPGKLATTPVVPPAPAPAILASVN